MENDVALTPVQEAFLRTAISGFSADEWTVTLAGQAASQRHFLRIKERGGLSRAFILVVWDAMDEDWLRFLAIPAELSYRVPLLPHIYASDAAYGLILEEDLGDQTLKRCTEDPACDRDNLAAVYHSALTALAEWQSLEPTSSATISSRSMDLNTFLWESEYFAKHCVASLCKCGHLLDAAWEIERRELAVVVSSLPTTFLHRDFQSENILLTSNQIRFVDFQGARLGPPAYDVASLLFDPYVAALDETTVAALFDYYSGLSLRFSTTASALYQCAAQRLMQALGAYANLSLNKGKPHYREFVPVALGRLQEIMKKMPEYQAMARVVEGCGEVAET